MQALNTAYLALPDADRTIQLAGQKLALAPHGDTPGSTTVQAITAVIGAETPVDALTKKALAALDQCAFFPTFEQFAANPPGLDQLRGAVPGLGPSSFQFPDSFLGHGFPSPANIAADPAGAGQQALGIFAEAIGSKTGFSMPGSGSGGMAIPGLDVGGLSRELGTIGDSVKDLLGKGADPSKWFDPSKFFNLDAKLLGVISLKDILKALGLDLSSGDAGKVGNEIQKLKDGLPKLPVELVYPGGDKTKLPEAVKVTLHYETPVKISEGEFGGFFSPDQNGMKTKLVLNAVFVTPFEHPDKTSYDVLGSLNDFDINLFGSDPDLQFFILEFKGIKFTSSSKSKPHLDVQLTNVKFGEALKFVKALQDLIKSETGLAIDVSPKEVSASASISLPSLTVGVMSLQNISIGFGFTLPFETGKVRVRANFCTREHPFILTVYIFGGGGFFGLALGLDGVELIEASFEFGAAASLDIGVASGSVHIMAGIYFKLSHDATKNSDVVELTGYVRAGGELKILGIITLSLEFYLSLTYVSPPGKAFGVAKMTVKVEVLFFSASVELEVKKEFGSDNADPRMIDMITQPQYTTYCGAFA
jgi:hypothetical protein